MRGAPFTLTQLSKKIYLLTQPRPIPCTGCRAAASSASKAGALSEACKFLPLLCRRICSGLKASPRTPAAPGPKLQSAVGSASMVSTRLRRRTTPHAPLLCSVLAMSGAEASGFTDLCSPRAKLNSIHWHRSGHVLGLLVHLALLSAASGWKMPDRNETVDDESSDRGSGPGRRRLASGCNIGYERCDESGFFSCGFEGSCGCDWVDTGGCNIGCAACPGYSSGAHVCSVGGTITSATCHPFPPPPFPPPTPPPAQAKT